MAETIEGSAPNVVRKGPDHRAQVKNRQRVRDLGEVFTHEREVNAMLDLVSEAFVDVDTKFLEPACGSGNFLVEILNRKLRRINAAKFASQAAYEFAMLRALASIYAVDISIENVEEARDRMKHILNEHYLLDAATWVPSAGYEAAVDEILRTNIVRGDSLNHAEDITLVEYQPGPRHTFVRTPSPLVDPPLDLFYEPPKSLPPVHYSKLGKEPAN